MNTTSSVSTADGRGAWAGPDGRVTALAGAPRLVGVSLTAWAPENLLQKIRQSVRDTR